MTRIYICLLVLLFNCNIRIAVSQGISEEELSCLNARRKIFAIDLNVIVSESSVDAIKGRQTRLVMSPRGLLRVDIGQAPARSKETGVKVSRADCRAMRVQDEWFRAAIDPSIFGRPSCVWSKGKTVEQNKSHMDFILDPLLIGIIPESVANLHGMPMDTVVGSANRTNVQRQAQDDGSVLVTYERKSSGAQVELEFEDRDDQVLLRRASVVSKKGASATVESVPSRHKDSGIWFPSEVHFKDLRDGQVRRFQTIQVTVNAINDANIEGNLSLKSLQLPEGTVFSGDHPELKKIPIGQWMVWRNGKMVLEPTELLEEFVAKVNRDQSQSMSPVATWRLFSMQNLGYFCIALAILVLAGAFIVRMRHAKS